MLEDEVDMDMRNLFKNDTNVKNYEAGDVIFEQDKPGENMYVIMDGEIDIQCNGQSIAKANPGETIGEMALIDNQSRCATAVALTPCKLVEVDENRFKLLVQQTPHFALQVMKMMTQRLRSMDTNK
jgi:CRP-like cAMP-binding protein